MQAAELREKSDDELNAQLIGLLRNQFDFRMQKTTGQLKQTHLLKQTRRDIARVKTAIAERTGK